LGAVAWPPLLSEAYWRRELICRDYYRRFYEYWKDGDINREWVKEARRKLG
jgi:hypothetical protein